MSSLRTIQSIACLLNPDETCDPTNLEKASTLIVTIASEICQRIECRHQVLVFNAPDRTPLEHTRTAILTACGMLGTMCTARRLRKSKTSMCCPVVMQFRDENDAARQLTARALLSSTKKFHTLKLKDACTRMRRQLTKKSPEPVASSPTSTCADECHNDTQNCLLDPGPVPHAHDHGPSTPISEHPQMLSPTSTTPTRSTADLGDMPLTNLPGSKEKYVTLFPAAITAFERAKHAIAQATKLSFLDTHESTKLILKTDASNAVVLHQVVNNTSQLLAFFPQKMQAAQTRYSTFGRELLAICLAIRNFRYLLKGRYFTIQTDHKPLTYAFNAKPDRCSPREISHLDYISQFTTDIRYTPGSDNVVTDALSRPDINALHPSTQLDLAKPANLQNSSPNFLPILSFPSLQVSSIPLPPIVPEAFRRAVSDHFHGFSHPGIRATRKLISARFAWPFMNKDLTSWAKQCIARQRSKVTRHTNSPIGSFAVPNAQFTHVHLDIVGSLSPSNGFTHILTMIDRFTRWPVAVPISDTSAETVAFSFLQHWVI
ncbi:hypothetical protein T265_08678 [Opisthorchis viverrini]|uniref:Integrase catalytic domain-containing protein n=1 Tax=Opisthorchis viverrini TaxID=6198 RepID=A0A075A7L4_OPIVI|nr:hypothetical protein T265_08678 [Opisthorchis viverrini]KER23459.1 hypothetical protein T265_08678 [Opisthorchis viverrini]